MPEGEDLWRDLNNGRDALLGCIVQCKERARIGRDNRARLANFTTEQDFYRKKIQDIKDVTNYMVKEYKNIEQYLIKRKELSTEMLKLAIEKVGLIVPDADTSGITLSIKDKAAHIVNEKGQPITLREGSAVSAILSALISYSLIKAQPDALQFMVFDESFAALSDTTAATFREYLDIFKEDMLILGIEQRNYLYDGIEKEYVYELIKGEGKSSKLRIVSSKDSTAEVADEFSGL